MLNSLNALEIIILASQYLMFTFYFYESARICHSTVRFGGLSCCRSAHVKPVL